MHTILKEILETERNYTAGTAQAMPEEAYPFKPSDTVWEFRELIHHMAYSIDWMNAAYLQSSKTAWNPGIVTGNKNQLCLELNNAFKRLEQSFSSSTMVNEKLVPAFYAILMHNAHHRGQATTYLRCKGVTPPDYPF